MAEDVLAPGVPVTQDEQPNVAQDTELTPETAFDATKDKSNLIDDFFRANEMHDRVSTEESQVEPEASPEPISSNLRLFTYVLILLPYAAMFVHEGD